MAATNENEFTRLPSSEYLDEALREIEEARSLFASEEELEAARKAVSRARSEDRIPTLPRIVIPEGAFDLK
jgi:hypothetical protein